MAKRKAGEPVTITVRLRTVPFDMMRYDRASPKTEGDAGKLERLAHDRTAVEVDFVCYLYGAPTLGRWKSFGCEVVAVEGKRIAP